MDEKSGQYFKAERPEIRYQKCDNHANYKVCNGMVNLDTFERAEDNDEVARSHSKHAMGEQYRTLLGHFRHELGHYYFDKLIAG